MTDRQLRYILTIVEEGSLTSAAQKLYISQPSLSALLAKVEGDYGAKLFDRSTSPLKLTYAGECYIQAARQMLGIQKELRDKISDVQNNNAGKLSIGCGTHMSAYFFPLILPVFMARYPKVQLELLEDNIMRFEKLLISDTLDLVFSTSPIYNSDIEGLPLFSEEVILLIPSFMDEGSNKYIQGRAFPIYDINALKDRPFVLFKKGRHLRRVSERIFEDNGINPNILLETNNWETCYSMVAEGLACTMLPHTPFKQILIDKHVKRYSLEGRPYRTYTIYYKKREYISKIMEHFISLSKEMICNVVTNFEKQ